MKILENKIRKGIMKVLPESLDDLWHLYNVILKNDEVYGRTTREVRVEEQYARPQKGKKVSVLLGVKVENVLWDKTLNRLRIHGIVCEAPEKISVKGSHHTINVIVSKPIKIVKHEWLKHQIDRIDRASKVKVMPIIVTSVDNEEYCVAVLRQYGIDVKVEEKTKLPGKLEAEKRTKAQYEFYKRALKSMREVWMNLGSPIVIIGLGFVKNDFIKYMNRIAPELAGAVLDVKSVNSAGLAGIYEALRSGVFTKAVKHVRIAEESKVMEEVLARLGRGGSNVTYGFSQVEIASGYGAVETLLLADVTLRETSDEKRVTLEKLIKGVEEKGGRVTVISTEHEAGAKLLSLGGIAALLRFPVG